jgi:hypothetical protein
MTDERPTQSTPPVELSPALLASFRNVGLVDRLIVNEDDGRQIGQSYPSRSIR